jgi:hypothetical protein
VTAPIDGPEGAAHQHLGEGGAHHDPQHRGIAGARGDDAAADQRLAQLALDVHQVGELGHERKVYPAPVS